VKNIVHFLYKSKLAILGILCLLVVQAYCDLALPSYTSDILNVCSSRAASRTLYWRLFGRIV
jgi:hypothetical protein